MTRQTLQKQCSWCGEDFTYSRMVTTAGRIIDEPSVCSHRCAGDSGVRRSLPPVSVLRRLYVSDNWSVARIAERFDSAPSSVWDALAKSGLELRTYTSVRDCIVCGAPVEKRTSQGKLTGRRCRVHRLEHIRQLDVERVRNFTSLVLFYRIVRLHLDGRGHMIPAWLLLPSRRVPVKSA